jgi:hypothetical protein
MINLGEWKYDYNMPRSTWRQQLEAEGVNSSEPAAFLKAVDERYLDPDKLAEQLSDNRASG